MASGHGPFFETLEPPPGGLEGLRSRLARDTRRRRVRARVLAGVGAFAVLLAATWTARAPGYTADDLPPEFDLVRMHLGLTPLPSEPVTIPEHRREDTAVQRVPLPTDDVIFYLVGSIRDE